MSTPELSEDRKSADRQYERAMATERGVWTSWMERVLRNGPRDEEAAAAVLASATRYNGLDSMRRSFGDPFFDPDFLGYEAKTDA